MLSDADLTYIESDLVRRKTDGFGEELATIDEAQILLKELRRLRDGIRELHYRRSCECDDCNRCERCGWDWPCPEIQLIGVSDAA